MKITGRCHFVHLPVTLYICILFKFISANITVASAKKQNEQSDRNIEEVYLSVAGGECTEGMEGPDVQYMC